MPEAPPIGFKDLVMRRVGERLPNGWKWIIAAALTLPSFLFLAWEIATRGDHLLNGIARTIELAQGNQPEMFFFVDGLVVLAVALLALGSIIAAHALLEPAERTAR